MTKTASAPNPDALSILADALKRRDEMLDQVIQHLIGIQKTGMRDSAALFVDCLNATKGRPAGTAFRKPNKLDDPSDEAQAEIEERLIKAVQAGRKAVTVVQEEGQ